MPPTINNFKKIYIMKKEKFIVNGVLCISNCGGYEIQINDNGDVARYRLRCMDKIIRVGKWQNIKFSLCGRAYITDANFKIYFDNVIKANF